MESGEYAGYFREHNVTHAHYILLCMGHNSAKLDKIAELKASMESQDCFHISKLTLGLKKGPEAHEEVAFHRS